LGFDDGAFPVRESGEEEAVFSVKSLDLVELNPLFDHDHQTARRAALTLWYF
jgi:arginase family enzyme